MQLIELKDMLDAFEIPGHLRKDFLKMFDADFNDWGFCMLEDVQDPTALDDFFYDFKTGLVTFGHRSTHHLVGSFFLTAHNAKNFSSEAEMDKFWLEKFSRDGLDDYICAGLGCFKSSVSRWLTISEKAPGDKIREVQRMGFDLQYFD